MEFSMDDEEKLAQGLAAGATPEQMARQMGFSRNQTLSVMKLLHLEWLWSPEEDKRLIELMRAQATDEEMQFALRRPMTSIRDRTARLGFDLTTNPIRLKLKAERARAAMEEAEAEEPLEEENDDW